MAIHNDTCGCAECANYGQTYNPGAIHNQSCGCAECGNYAQPSHVQSVAAQPAPTMNTSQHAALEARLDKWSIEGTAAFKQGCGVVAGDWLQMEADLGTVGACKRILHTDWPSQSYVPVLEHLLAKDLFWTSAEAVAGTDDFFTASERKELFTESAVKVAENRCAEFGYVGRSR